MLLKVRGNAQPLHGNRMLVVSSAEYVCKSARKQCLSGVAECNPVEEKRWRKFLTDTSKLD
jgi:hypothetical protein